MRVSTYQRRPTDTLGERITARSYDAGRSRTVPWDYGLSGEQMHQFAAESLAGAPVTMVRSLPTGYVWETVPESEARDAGR